MAQKFPSGIFTGRPGMAFYAQNKGGQSYEVSISQLREVLTSIDRTPTIRALAGRYIASCNSISLDMDEEMRLRQEEKRLRLELFREAGALIWEKFPGISQSFYGLIIHEFLHNLELELGEQWPGFF